MRHADYDEPRRDSHFTVRRGRSERLFARLLLATVLFGAVLVVGTAAWFAGAV